MLTVVELSPLPITRVTVSPARVSGFPSSGLTGVSSGATGVSGVVVVSSGAAGVSGVVVVSSGATGVSGVVVVSSGATGVSGVEVDSSGSDVSGCRLIPGSVGLTSSVFVWSGRSESRVLSTIPSSFALFTASSSVMFFLPTPAKLKITVVTRMPIPSPRK
ncbi:MAG: hypothetical protein EGR90_00710 [Lachnospiraceae bacterium]|nr:hypothetical protein [Lachnospiraceae bacterium]